MENPMNWKILFVSVCTSLMITGCGAKENFIVLSPASDGSVGALEIATEKGSSVLDEAGHAIYIDDRESAPSEPTVIDMTETQAIFEDALSVQPMMPQSFLLYFQFNSNELTAESQKLIPDILAAIKNRESKDISVIGHSDRKGGDEYNRILSMERAQVVYDILRAENVKGEEMTILYHGEGNPLVPTADDVAEPRNRRVEVMVR